MADKRTKTAKETETRNGEKEEKSGEQRTEKWRMKWKEMMLGWTHAASGMRQDYAAGFAIKAW